MKENYLVEKDFLYKDLRCVVIMTNMGHRCGYVGVPKDNPLYKKHYNDKVNILRTEDVKGQEIGKRGMLAVLCEDWEAEEVTPSAYFDVHGGITFSDGGESTAYPVKSDLWWVGYDCNHYNDAQDPEYMNDDMKRITEKYPSMYSDGIIRSLKYCIDECKSLAKQIFALTTKED